MKIQKGTCIFKTRSDFCPYSTGQQGPKLERYLDLDKVQFPMKVPASHTSWSKRVTDTEFLNFSLKLCPEKEVKVALSSKLGTVDVLHFYYLKQCSNWYKSKCRISLGTDRNSVVLNKF